MATNRIKQLLITAATCSVIGSATLLSTFAAAASLEDIKARGTLTASVYKDFPPYSYSDKGKKMGIDVEIAETLAKKLGVNSDIRFVGADENVEDDLRNNVWKGHYLGGGVTDIMLHMPYDRQFMQMVDQVSFVAPYQLEQLNFAFDTKQIGTAPTLANFMSAPVGVEIDTLSDFYLLEAMQKKIQPNVRHFESLSKAAEALKAGEIAAIMGPKGELEGVLADRPEHITVQSLVMPGLQRSSWAMGIAVKAEFGDLSKAIDGAMTEMAKDGSLKAIFEKYKVTLNPPAEAPGQSASN